MESEIDLEAVKNLQFDLKNIVSVLRVAYNKLDERAKGDLVIVLGCTGDGKSTMLGSLMYGPKNLEERYKSDTVKVPKIDAKGH